MGICLALDVLERGANGGRHGGKPEAVDELVRESFWMTDDELDRAQRWASANSAVLQIAIDAERSKRRANQPIGYRVN